MVANGRPCSSFDARATYAKLMDAARGTKCPVTGGQPLRITRNAWDIICKQRLKSGVPAASGLELYGRFHGKEYRACVECKGSKVPDEVEFISDEEVAMIAKSRRHHER